MPGKYCKWQSNVTDGGLNDRLNQGSSHQLVPVGQRAVLLGFYIGVDNCTVEFSNGSAGDTTLFQVKNQQNGARPSPFHIVPGGGMLFDNGINLRMASSNTSDRTPRMGIFYEA